MIQYEHEIICKGDEPVFIKKLHQQVICNHHKPVANTPLGQLRGVKTEDAYIFRGIKYANARRFHMPEPVESWDGIRDAIIYGFVCPEITTPVPACILSPA